MKLAYLAFTEQGERLAARLAAALGGGVQRCGGSCSLSAWTAAHFPQSDGLVYIGAAGIAVRAIAPHLQSKTSDPAVVVVDACARYAIPILSGHLGGANDLARAIGRVCGALPVLTTATDVNGVFAVDEWAKRQNCRILNPERIKTVSAKLLAGGAVTVQSAWPIAGQPPRNVRQTEDSGADVLLELRPSPGEALHLVPRIAVLGVGCKKNVLPQTLEAALAAFLTGAGICEQAISAVASIDLKKEEPGLVAFCAAQGWPLKTYSAEQLRAVEGRFTPSAFVQSVIGVDNVCERSAVLASGGTLCRGKTAGNGVTMALALAPYRPDWRWQDE